MDKNLEYNLKAVSNHHKWFHTNHPPRNGGGAMGVHEKWVPKIVEVKVDESNRWVSVEIKAEERFVVVSLYAGGPSFSHPHLWNSLTLFPCPLILVGDFNMVEEIEDRFQNKGSTISGREKKELEMCKGSNCVMDVCYNKDFTWSNSLKGSLDSKARLDRAYLSTGLMLSFSDHNAKVYKGIALSDHKPIVMTLTNSLSFKRAGWFHVDLDLFNLPSVRRQVKEV